MNIEFVKEEMRLRGVSFVGNLLTPEEVGWFLNDLADKKKKDIEEFGREDLIKNNSLETVSDLGRFAGEYYSLLENEKLNQIVNALLNDKAVVHSYNAIILDGAEKSTMVGHNFHRDMPWFPDCRTSIIVMIPLINFSAENGSTQYVAGSHAFNQMPSMEYLEKYAESVVCGAGEGFVVDSTTWHRAGKNNSGKARPMIVIKYTLAPFKQQIEFYLSNPGLPEASLLVKQRLGWNVRVPHDYIENRDWNQETRKFKSGQYDMTNTYLK